MESETSEQKPTYIPPKSRFLFVFITVVVTVIMAIIGIGGYELGKLNIQQTKSLSRQPASPTIGGNTNQNTSLRDFYPVSYSVLGQKLLDSDITKFSDDYFHISFFYPKNYFVNIIDADAKNPTIIYFANSPTAQELKNINTIVDCEKSNRITANGICSESIVSDMDIAIRKSSTRSIEPLDKYCDKEIISDNKTVVSCLVQDIGRNPEYLYTVYFSSKDTTYIMTIYTRDVFRVQDGIKTIVESFTTNNK